MKTNIYVDGFNFYYGCIKGTPYRWLDLAKLFQLLLPNDEINRIRYFTAKVNPHPYDPTQPQRQQAYLRALETLPNLSIHLGHFLTNTVSMPLAHPPRLGSRMVDVLKTEEKGSDVNIATYLLIDSFRGECEQSVIVSNDSDLVTPIEMVQAIFGIRVGVFNPHPKTSWALRNAADFYRPIRKGPLSASQFPDQLSDSQGNITKPPSW
ncbi:MAG: NYN domain-containing protein [Chloroflexota bacterium]|nr:NYN domain-containing protein [Chloroflexota bacterium]